MTLQDLVTKYTFDIDTKPLEDVQNKVSGLVGFAAKLGAAGAAAAGTLFALAKTTASAGDEALAASQKLGISVEKLTQMQYAAKLSNMEAGQFNVGLKFLSKNMDEAGKGTGETAETFKKFGISVKDSTGKLRPTDEVLLALSDKFKAMPDGAQKTATAMKIFGRSGMDMIPMLNEGAAGIQKMMNRADELGLTMSTELAQAGDDFNDSMDEMLGGLTGLRNMIGAKLIPIITPIIKKITEWMIANRKLISIKLEQYMKILMGVAKGVWDIFTGLFNVVQGITRVFGGLENTVKLVAGAFMLFAGAKILFMIGTLAVSLGGLASAITAVNVSALLIPTLIGAAIVLLALLIEDVYTFFTDPQAQTFTKDLVEGVKSLWTTLSGFFDNMGFWGKAIINFLLTPLRMVLNTISALKTAFDVITGKVSIWQGIKTVGANTLGALKGSGQDGSLSQAFGFNPAASPATTSTAQDNSVSSQAQIVNNINLGAGVDPTLVGKSVQQGTKQGMDESLRGAQRSFSKKGGY